MIQLEDSLRPYPVRRSKFKCIVCNGPQWEFPYLNFSSWADICARCKIIKWAPEDFSSLSERNAIILQSADVARNWHPRPVQEVK